VIQGFQKDPSLKFVVVRHAEVVPHPEGHEDGAGRLRLLRHIQSNRDRNGRYASAFNGALHERDRLVSYRSRRAQQGDVRALGNHCFSDLFRQRALQSLGVHVIADEREEVWCQSADHAVGR